MTTDDRNVLRIPGGAKELQARLMVCAHTTEAHSRWRRYRATMIRFSHVAAYHEAYLYILGEGRMRAVREGVREQDICFPSRRGWTLPSQPHHTTLGREVAACLSERVTAIDASDREKARCAPQWDTRMVRGFRAGRGSGLDNSTCFIRDNPLLKSIDAAGATTRVCRP